MTQLTVTNTLRSRSLPQLHKDPERAAEYGAFLEKLNTAPKPEWVKTNQGVKYLPIERVENLLRTIYQRWEVGVVDFKVVANAICVHVRLRVQDPVYGEWIEQDGLGAVPIQVKSGSSPTAFDSIVPNAIQKNLPAAESLAIKDAAEKLGKVFGSDLNRRDEIAFHSVYADWANANAEEQQ